MLADGDRSASATTDDYDDDCGDDESWLLLDRVTKDLKEQLQRAEDGLLAGAYFTLGTYVYIYI